MKKSLNLAITLIALFVWSAGTLVAQNAQKIAYIDSDDIIQNMAEYKKANIDLEAFSNQLQKQLQNEEAKLLAYRDTVVSQNARGEITPKKLQEAEQKLKEMQQALQKKTVEAQQKLQQKEQELLQPVNDMFTKALQTVSEKEGYTYILDKKVFLYLEGGIDATQAVKDMLLTIAAGE